MPPVRRLDSARPEPSPHLQIDAPSDTVLFTRQAMPKIRPTIPARPPGLEAALDQHVFSTWDQDFLKTDFGITSREDVIETRFANALRFSVPWLNEHIDLAQARIVEIGCGSGSSTAALGLHCQSVRGFD